MSFDLSLPTVCNHTIYRELVDLNEDRETLRLAQPMAAIDGRRNIWPGT